MQNCYRNTKAKLLEMNKWFRIIMLAVVAIAATSCFKKVSLDCRYNLRPYFQAESGGETVLGENTIATHRITEVLIDENDPTVRRFFTKGDANAMPDAASVHYKNIIGINIIIERE